MQSKGAQTSCTLQASVTVALLCCKHAANPKQMLVLVTSMHGVKQRLCRRMRLRRNYKFQQYKDPPRGATSLAAHSASHAVPEGPALTTRLSLAGATSCIFQCP